MVTNGIIGLLDRFQNTMTQAITGLGAKNPLSCGPGNVAADRRKAGIPAWRYRMFGQWPNLEMYPGMASYHSMDVPFVFGATERTSAIPSTPDQLQLEKNVMTAWATFAKDPEHGLEKLGWPLYDSTGILSSTITKLSN
jgi:cholinesterase